MYRQNKRIKQLEAQAAVRDDPQWMVHIDTVGMPEEEAEALRAEAERLAMPPRDGQIRIVEVSGSNCGVDPNWAAGEPRLTIIGKRA